MPRRSEEKELEIALLKKHILFLESQNLYKSRVIEHLQCQLLFKKFEESKPVLHRCLNCRRGFKQKNHLTNHSKKCYLAKDSIDLDKIYGIHFVSSSTRFD